MPAIASPDAVPVAAIVPCRNEEGSIAVLVADLLRIGVSTVVVGLDPNSTDGTDAVAAGAGATVVMSPTSGYDGPCLAALDHLRADGYDGYVLFLDAGNKYVMDSIGALLQTLRPGDDITFGVRDAQTHWHQRLGNNLFKVVLAVRFRHWVHDISSVRVARMDVLDRLRLEDRRFSLPFQTLVHALTLRLSLRYVPIRCTPHRVGVSKVSGDPRNSLRAARQMAVSVLRVPDLRADEARGHGR